MLRHQGTEYYFEVWGCNQTETVVAADVAVMTAVAAAKKNGSHIQYCKCSHYRLSSKIAAITEITY